MVEFLVAGLAALGLLVWGGWWFALNFDEWSKKQNK